MGCGLLVALLCTVNLPLLLVPPWHKAAVSLAGFVPILFSVNPFFSSYRLIAAAFLHGDLFHLAGNRLFLIVFGRTLGGSSARSSCWSCSPLGSPAFLVQWTSGADSAIPVIGASGAIVALMGHIFPYSQWPVFAWSCSSAGSEAFHSPAWVFLPYWMGLQIISILLGSGMALHTRCTRDRSPPGPWGQSSGKLHPLGPKRGFPNSSGSHSSLP